MNLNRAPFLHMSNWIYWGFTMYLFRYFFRNWEKPIPWYAVLISFLYILAICLKSPVTHPDYRSIYIYIYTQAHLSWGFHDIWHCTLSCKDENFTSTCLYRESYYANSDFTFYRFSDNNLLHSYAVERKYNYIIISSFTRGLCIILLVDISYFRNIDTNISL